ncbi:MAG: N-acetyltransferase, partial [Rhodospirillales bacterium]|nr:N-acetyltransferase [Rhodospirillales bacterium]
VAFMITLPDLNQIQMRVNGRSGKPSPLGWLRLALWLRKPKDADMRVPLMGVLKRLQSSRMASQLAFMMIEDIRRDATAAYASKRGEIGWVLDDNQGMNAIADAIGSKVNREYRIYGKVL